MPAIPGKVGPVSVKVENAGGTSAEKAAAFRYYLGTVTFSRGTTATTEKVAPSGFQHLVQPQA